MRVLDIFKSVNKEDIAIELMKSYPNYFAKSDDYNINKFTSVKVIEQPIDYIRVKSIIATKQRESISFLNKAFTCKSFTHNR